MKERHQRVHKDKRDIKEFIRIRKYKEKKVL